MIEFIAMQQKIDGLSTRARAGICDAAMLAEMDDVLAQGYIQALVGDAQVRRLRASLQALTGEREGSISAGDVQRLLHEQLRIEQATRRLRASLAAMRAQFVRLGGAQLMSS